MAYKRKARILFLSDLPSTAQIALAYATDLGGDWIEASCACCRQDRSQPAATPAKMPGVPPCPTLNPELILRLDLIVTLGKKSRNCCHSLPARVQKRHYELASAQGEVDSGEIRQLILGIIGGIKMLAKSNASD